MREKVDEVTRAQIQRIAESRAAQRGVPQKADEVAQEVIAYREARNRRKRKMILSPLGERVNFLVGLAQQGMSFYRQRRAR